MKKFLACLLALVMALSLVACGDDITADDDATGDNDTQMEDASGVGEGTPLEAMTFVKVPDDIVGTSWKFAGGFKDGVEMDNDQATATLKAYGGTLQINFLDEANIEFVQGGGVLPGTCGADENNDMVVISIENEGTQIDYTCLFAELNDSVVMVMLAGEDANNAFYFTQVVEG